MFNSAMGNKLSLQGWEGARLVPSWLAVVADPIKLHIVSSLSRVDEATAADLASSGQASDQTLRRHLDALVSVGLIRENPGESDGETPGRPAARFTLQPAVRKSVQSVLSPHL